MDGHISRWAGDQRSTSVIAGMFVYGLAKKNTVLGISSAHETARSTMINKTILQVFAVAAFLGSEACLDSNVQQSATNPLRWDILVPDTASMARAWEFPRDPRVDTAGLTEPMTGKVLRGFFLFTNTSELTLGFTGGTMTCNNCHPNGGQREGAMPLVGVDRVFPEYNKRAGRVFTLEERIVGCFMRSINATGTKNTTVTVHHENNLNGATLSPECGEVEDLVAYIGWLSWNRTIDGTLPWRGHYQLPASSLLGLEKLNPKLGRRLFLEKCSNCHGEDGQGVFIGDKRPGPLWGSNSWNDGAGAARTYTFAGMIRYMMPYMDPGSLTDEEALHIAAFITSQPRPSFPYKDNDYLKEKIPTDAVYYKQLYAKNPLSPK